MSITLHPVKSSHLDAVGYDEKSKVLRIRFKDGSEWEYYNVLKQVHHRLVNAPSVGVYFNTHIKDNYPCKKAKEARSKPINP